VDVGGSQPFNSDVGGESVNPTPTVTPTVTQRPTERETVGEPTLSAYWPPSVARWEPLIVRYGRHYGIDPDLLAAVMTVESGGDPNAVSYAGAVGLMQVMPYDPAKFPQRPAAASLYDPDNNLAWGGRILASELEWASGDLALALGAYYDGRTRASAGWARTRAYASKVLAYYRAAQ
jgi:soluble lytic murein transglycosylase-like protein